MGVALPKSVFQLICIKTPLWIIPWTQNVILRVQNINISKLAWPTFTPVFFSKGFHNSKFSYLISKDLQLDGTIPTGHAVFGEGDYKCQCYQILKIQPCCHQLNDGWWFDSKLTKIERKPYALGWHHNLLCLHDVWSP